MVVTLVARNENVAMVGSGGVCVWQESGVKSGIQFCVGAFGRNPASVTVNMFSRLTSFIKKFYKSCTFNMIFKDNAAVNCITVQHKK
jgi:hypothetical protein